MKIKDTIIGIVALVWFLATFVGIIVVMESDNKWLALALGGQLSFILGIVIISSRIKEKNFNLVDGLLFIFPTLGLGGIVASLVIYFEMEPVIDFCKEYMVYAFLGVFLLAGLIMLFAWYRSTIWIKVICTQRIEAKCIEVKEIYKPARHGLRKSFCPVYQFYFNGNWHEVCNNVFFNLSKAQENEMYEIYVNPKNPNQYYEVIRGNATGIQLLIMGLVFTIMSVVVIILYSSARYGL